MGTISYESDQTPNFIPGMEEMAREIGGTVANIICQEPDGSADGGVSFAAVVATVPRAGDRITLQDGSLCEVKRVYFKVITACSRENETFPAILTPNVVAYRISR